MSKAEERALEAYPRTDNKTILTPFGCFAFNDNSTCRTAFINGYEQAEKDLALTADDIKTLNKLDRDIMMENPNLQYETKNKYFKILAERFNEQRKK